MLSIFIHLILSTPLSFATVQGQLQRFQVGQATQAPYASVGLINDFCSGTLIAANKVLTAGHCTYDVETKGGNAPDGRKVKATLHWVNAQESVPLTVRLYDHLFATEDPDDTTDKSTAQTQQG